MLFKLFKNTIIILLLQFSLVNIALAAESNIWSFVGRVAPDHWSKLDKKFETCNDGGPTATTMISKENIVKNAEPVIFDYKAYPVSNPKTVPYKKITIGKQDYKLVEFHVRLPSEHSINGEISKAAIHFIHQNENDQIAIVAVMLKIGKSNEIIKNLVATYNKSDAEKFAIEDGNLMSLVPTNTDYYYHSGNVTTPPCTKDGVSWYVMQNPVELSKEEMASLTATIEK
jgi:carbonic anhydrase